MDGSFEFVEWITKKKLNWNTKKKSEDNRKNGRNMEANQWIRCNQLEVSFEGPNLEIEMVAWNTLEED